MLRFIENPCPNRITNQQERMKINSFVRHHNNLINYLLYSKASTYPELPELKSMMQVHLWKMYAEKPNQKEGYYYIGLSNFLRSTLWRMQDKSITADKEYVKNSYMPDESGFISTEMPVHAGEHETFGERYLKSESIIDKIDEKIDIEKREKYLSERTKTVLIMSYLAPSFRKKQSNNLYSRVRRDIRKNLQITNRQMKAIQNEVTNAYKNRGDKIFSGNEISNLIAEEI